MVLVSSTATGVKDARHFLGAVKAKPDEIVVFSWVEWPSREARDKGWEEAMKDPRMKNIKMPFDGQRMIYGGFAPLVDQ